MDATIDTLFVDTLNNNLSSSDTWQAELKVNDKLVKFRLDTGADATVLPLDTFNQLLSAPLSPPDKVLCGPNRAKLDVVGYFTAVLEWRGKQTTQTVYVLRDVHQPLLGQSAIEALGLIKRLCAVTDNTDPKQQYSDLFTGLGSMEGEYTIRLKPDAQPFAVFTPRRVPVNLLPQLKNELDKLESLGGNQACRRADTVGCSNCCHSEENIRHQAVRGPDSAKQCCAPRTVHIASH